MTAVTRHAIVIERRFHGPPQSGHGGYTCGPLARELHLAVQMSLRDDEAILADAQATTPGFDRPPHVGRAAPHAASSRCLGFAPRPFPTCFGCGPNRAEG